MTYTAECDQAFTANKVDYFDPMTLLFYVSCDGGSTWKYAGASGNQMYVTYATPIATVQLFHTILHLACSNPGATDGDSVIANVWQQFAGPANVKTWDGKDLIYYDTENGSGNGSASAILEDVQDDGNGDGQCGAFMELFGDAIEANGVDGLYRVALIATNADRFAVAEIDFGTPSYPGESYYKYHVDDLNKTISNLPGQNINPPKEKYFSLHYVISYGIFGSYYDPSYGVIHDDADDFKSKIDGWRRMSDEHWREAPGTTETITPDSTPYQ